MIHFAWGFLTRDQIAKIKIIHHVLIHHYEQVESAHHVIHGEENLLQVIHHVIHDDHSPCDMTDHKNMMNE